MGAAEQLAAMDLRGTDVVTPWDTAPRWPDPGEACMDIFATAQLYWPALRPGQASEYQRGCIRCGTPVAGFSRCGRCLALSLSLLA